MSFLEVKMTSVDEYVGMAEAAQKDGAHVAVLTYYRDAIEETGYNSNAAPVLLAAIQYAQKLKKGRDRKAIADWGMRALGKIKPDTSLEATINQEIAKLQTVGKENAAP